MERLGMELVCGKASPLFSDMLYYDGSYLKLLVQIP